MLYVINTAMAQIIAVANLKGGSGKSSISVNLAGELASKQVRLVLLDADEQGTAAGWAEAGKLPFSVDFRPLKHPKEWIDHVLSIDAACVIVDCPPSVGAVTQAATGVSDLVLIPIFSSVADLRATVRALELVELARAGRKNGAPLCLLVPSRIDRRTMVGREIESALKQFGEPIGPAIHQRSAFIDSCTEGRWIGDYAPASAAHEDVKALAAAVRRRLKL